MKTPFYFDSLGQNGVSWARSALLHGNAYCTELNLKICDYPQTLICRQNSKKFTEFFGGAAKLTILAYFEKTKHFSVKRENKYCFLHPPDSDPALVRKVLTWQCLQDISIPIKADRLSGHTECRNMHSWPKLWATAFN